MPHAADNTSKKKLRKRDKLKSSLEIEAIYHENKFVVSFPLKCYYSLSDKKEQKNELRVAFAVPKKNFKRAVDRNMLKRRMREAYRLHFRTFFETFMKQGDKKLALFFIYVGKDLMDFERIAESLLVVFRRLEELPMEV
jgi:ribonuclease P protein component